MAYLDTPRTDAGNLTFLAGQAAGIDDLSPEKSFVEPKKRDHDLVAAMRQKRNGLTQQSGASAALRTPSAAQHGSTAAGSRTPGAARAALSELASRTGSNAVGRRSGEFTPLLKSVTKRNASNAAPKVGKENRAFRPETPQFLKKGQKMTESPALPRPELSVLSQSGSFLPLSEQTPLPPSSSAASTPLAFPGRGEGVIENGRNMMNLREQERVCHVR